MNKDLFHFIEFDQAIRRLYDTVPLDDIESLEFEEKNSVTFFSEVLRKKRNLKEFPY